MVWWCDELSRVGLIQSVRCLQRTEFLGKENILRGGKLLAKVDNSQVIMQFRLNITYLSLLRSLHDEVMTW